MSHFTNGLRKNKLITLSYDPLILLTHLVFCDADLSVRREY